MSKTLSAEQGADSQQRMVSRFHVWFMLWQSRRAAKTIEQFAPTNVLEIGCGHGWLSDAIAAGGITVLKTDFNPTLPDAVHVDAHDTLFADKSFDLIVCSNTLEHLHSPLTALKEMNRIGNRLWLTWTPWWSPFGCHAHFPWHWFKMNNCGEHKLGVNLYKTTVAQTLKQLADAGWRVITVRPRYWPWLSFLARWRWTREWATWNVEVVCSANR